MKSVLIGAILIGLISTGLCIKCYVGVGDVGGFANFAVITQDGFKSCSIEKVETGDASITTRAGSALEGEDKCEDRKLFFITTTNCTCITDLCNSAPATVHALIPVLVVAMLVKFII